MAETEKTTLLKIGKLIDRLREVQAQEYEITDEIRKLLGGAAGIAVELKQFQAAFDAAWCSRYAPGEVGRYVWQFVRDVPHQKRLIKALGVDELERRAAVYIRDDDPYYRKARHPFGLFVGNVNRFAADQAPTDLELEPVADCKHDPPCKSDQEHTRRRSDDMRRPF